MVGLLRRFVPVLLLAYLAVGLSASPGEACPFCTDRGQTLNEEVSLASMVIFGDPRNADLAKDTTDLKIEVVVKDHKARNKKLGVIKLSRYIPPAEDGKQYKYLVFFDVFEKKMDAYRGVNLKPDSKLPEYLRRARAVKDKPLAERLRFFFDYLDSDDLDVASDSYKEFGNTDYKDYRGVAKTLPADRVVRWLKDPNTPSMRFGLYASMLGHCGKEKDSAILKHLLDDPDHRAGSGVDGVFAAYVMLKPKEGWKYLTDVLKDNKQDFIVRYAALRAVRFLHDYRTDLVSKKDLVAGSCLLLSQDDIADLAIEDLRKWQCWDKANQVLALRGTPVYNKMPIVRRAMLRYCLSCPANAAAKAYVAERRKADAEGVEEAEELLKLEVESARPAKK